MSLRRRVLYSLAVSDRFEEVARRVPAFEAAALRAASRYVAGPEEDDAARVAVALDNEGVAASLDFFGEATTDPAEVERAGKRYEALAGRLVELPATTWLAIDLSHLGLDISEAVCLDRLERIVAALPAGRRLQVGAEDHARNARIRRIVTTLAAQGAPVTATLQANLFESEGAGLALAAAGVPIRLTKGAYVEAPGLARAWGEATDLAFLDLARRLHAEGAELSLATHDPVLREALLAALGPLPVEMLLGVRPADSAALVARGITVRRYVPFGSGWWRYWMRRVAESQGA
jgi:proline dehydrogenase